MRKWIGAFVVLAATIFLVYGSQPIVGAAQSNMTTAKIAVNVLNVRQGPSLSDPVIARVTQGDQFQVLDKRYGWLEIALNGSQKGWVAGQFTVQKTETKANPKVDEEKSASNPVDSGNHTTITMLYNGTNLRSGPGTSNEVLSQASQGDQFKVIGEKDNWYHIQLPNGKDAYVASWIVVPTKKEQKALSGKTIVVDPGHGGFDTGAIGYKNEVEEKNLTLVTAKELAKKLRKAGAHVILTRDSDTYLTLQDRVNIAENHKADAFISIHYNASMATSAHGVTSYYYTKRKDQPLALAIQQMLAKQTDRENRGVRFANYHVLRENSRPATLLELGFVTNPWEEHVIQTSAYQDTVTTAIVDGVENYFQGN